MTALRPASQPSWSARAVAFTSAYVLIAESVFAALAALLLGQHLEAGFRGLAGGLLGAAQAPGAPLLLEGLLPAVFGPAAGVGLGLLAFFAVHALVAPWVQLSWLAGLASVQVQRVAPARPDGALRVGGAAYLAGLRLRLMLLVPAGFLLVVLAILVTYASLLLAHQSERAHDLGLLGALLLGAVLFTPLRVLADLGHASLVSATLAGERPSARQAIHDSLRGFSLAAYARWCASVGLGLAVLLAGSLVAAGCPDALALLLTQLAAFVRYALRGAWLASALGVVSGERRLGSLTRNSAPPPPSSALVAEMVPP